MTKGYLLVAYHINQAWPFCCTAGVPKWLISASWLSIARKAGYTTTLAHPEYFEMQITRRCKDGRQPFRNQTNMRPLKTQNTPQSYKLPPHLVMRLRRFRKELTPPWVREGETLVGNYAGRSHASQVLIRRNTGRNQESTPRYTLVGLISWYS